MKNCPYCAEKIQDNAVKCRFCGEFFNKGKEEPWYLKTYWLVIAFLCVGPLALPLLWINPRFSHRRKIIISIIIAAVTYYTVVVMAKSVRIIESYYNMMFQQL